MRFRGIPVVLAPLLVGGCDAPGDVAIQELPALSQTSVEARLGLPELRGPWRFAGWELEAGDTTGLEAELPDLGVLMLQEQKRDSLAGFYAAGGGRAPVQGEIRRDGVVALVAFPQAGDGRYLVGQVAGDTLWVESTTLVAPEAWRGEARAAFVRSQGAVAPFLRVRGRLAPPPPPDSTALAVQMDSLVADSAVGALPPPGAATRPGGAQPIAPTAVPRPAAGAPGVTQPPRTRTGEVVPQAARDTVEEADEEEPEPRPEPQPAIERREAPRILGVPVQRDTAGGGDLP